MRSKIAYFAGAAVAALTVAVSGARAAEADLVDTAVASGQFQTLAAALDAAGLVETLKGPGPFTVFAPTDEAFAKLPEGTVETLLQPENKDQLSRHSHLPRGPGRGDRRGGGGARIGGDRQRGHA